MIFAVIFTACTINGPKTCEQHTLPLHRANELTCLMIGQAEIARKLTPGWRVARFGCTRLGVRT